MKELLGSFMACTINLKQVTKYLTVISRNIPIISMEKSGLMLALLKIRKQIMPMAIFTLDKSNQEQTLGTERVYGMTVMLMGQSGFIRDGGKKIKNASQGQ